MMPTSACRAAGLALTGLLLTLVATVPASAVSISTAPGSPTLPPPIPPGPCPGPFSPDGDIYDPVAATIVPMGPAGCGLGWPAPVPPGNVDAFSSGLSPIFIPLPSPIASASFSLDFTVDSLATGDATSTCAAVIPGPFAPDLATEACALPTGTDGPADVYTAVTNPVALPAAPAAGTMPHFQSLDGDGSVSAPCGFAPRGTLGLVEPIPGGDDVDAYDTTPMIVWDLAPVGGDGVPDLPVYYSVDGPTAAASAGFSGPADVLMAIGGLATTIYAPAAALGLGPGDDIDGLVVLDVAFDGIYAPGAADQIFYSLAPGSAAIGAADGCLGLPISAGDVLSEGTPYGGTSGIPCIVIPDENIGIWSLRLCGANALTGVVASDNVNGIDFGPAIAGPPGSTSTTTTSTVTTTTSTTTTTLLPLCAPTPAPDCKLGAAGKSKVDIKAKGDLKDKFKWKLNKGEMTLSVEFLDPVGSAAATYRACVYDGSGLPQPLMEMDIPPMGTCSAKPCWKATGTKGFKYKDKAGTPSGVIGAKLKEGLAGKSRVLVKGKGSRLPTPTLPLTFPLVVQLLIDDGVEVNCWQNTFTTAMRNGAGQTKAKGP